MDHQSSCGMLIKQINSALEKRANNALRSQGLTVAQVSALLVIREAPDQTVSLKELEKVLHVAQSTTAGIISRLEQKGMVTSLEDTRDKRIKLVRMTPTGETFCRRAERNMEEAEKTLLSSLSRGEKKQFSQLLQKVFTSLE